MSASTVVSVLRHVAVRAPVHLDACALSYARSDTPADTNTEPLYQYEGYIDAAGTTGKQFALDEDLPDPVPPAFRIGAPVHPSDEPVRLLRAGECADAARGRERTLRRQLRKAKPSASIRVQKAVLLRWPSALTTSGARKLPNTGCGLPRCHRSSGSSLRACASPPAEPSARTASSRLGVMRTRVLVPRRWRPKTCEID